MIHSQEEFCRDEIKNGFIDLTNYTEKRRRANDTFFEWCKTIGRPNVTVQGKKSNKYYRVESDWITAPHKGYSEEGRNEIIKYAEQHREDLKSKTKFYGCVGYRYVMIDINRDLANELASLMWRVSE
jgi:hypothetical protein